VHDFLYRGGTLHCEEIPAEQIARVHGTPCYVYSRRTFLDHFRKLRDAFAPISPKGLTICYSVKANSNLTLMRLIRQEGAGFDVVSGGELFRVLKIGGDPKKVVFAGVGKTDEEIAAGLKAGIFLFNVESEQELEVMDGLARKMGLRQDVALRVNPDVDPKTHRHTATGKREAKFGVDLVRAEAVLRAAQNMKGIRMRGLHAHIGSPITSSEPYVETLHRIQEFLDRIDLPIDLLDIGGGFGIWYKEKRAKTAVEMAAALEAPLRRLNREIVMEPGRFIAGNSGILLTRVVYVKDSGDKKFIICDAGMNDLIRPVLYDAYHRVWPAQTDPAHQGDPPDEETWRGPVDKCDVVGPICESGDYFAKDRNLPPVRRGDLLAVFSAGAYGYVMSSTYNTHPRPAEVLVDGDRGRVVTRRETYEDLVRLEE
jgi:diaminopimelate decarboxylase